MNPEENVFSFNFWPSFADLMLAIVLILIIVIFVIYSVLSAGSVNLRHVEERQHTMIDELAASHGTTAKELTTKTNGEPAKDSKTKFYAIFIDRDTIPDVMIRNEPTLQRFSFGSHILFAKNGTELTSGGQQVLRSLGASLKKQLPIIREIQIQGHADPDLTRSYRSNLDLAAMRAIEVYRFFQNSIGIDPAQYLMSATSFGEFKPVQRLDEDAYSLKKLNAHNFTEAQKSQNRRIELLLFYRF